MGTAEKTRGRRLSSRRVGLLIVAGLVVALVAVGAFALFGGFDRTVTERVSGGGERMVRVALVDAVVGFDVTPDEIVAHRGTHLVLEVVNEGDEPHNLSTESGRRTRTLAPGQSQRLDLGTIQQDLPELYCTLPGHRSAGMTMRVRVD